MTSVILNGRVGEDVGPCPASRRARDSIAQHTREEGQGGVGVHPHGLAPSGFQVCSTTLRLVEFCCVHSRSPQFHLRLFASSCTYYAADMPRFCPTGCLEGTRIPSEENYRVRAAP